MIDVIVVQRRSDFMAHLYGNKETYEVANTPEEAIGKLIITLANDRNSGVLVTERKGE